MSSSNLGDGPIVARLVDGEVTETADRWLPVMATAPTPLLTTRVLTGAETA